MGYNVKKWIWRILSLLSFLIAILAGLKEEWFILAMSTIFLQICLLSILRIEINLLKNKIDLVNENVYRTRDVILDILKTYKQKILNLKNLITNEDNTSLDL